MDRKQILKTIRRIFEPLINSLGYELVETEYLNERGRWVLRCYIDKEGGGITLDDCSRVSESIGSLLDVEDVIPGSYNLEVSSPGTPRPVRRAEDFIKFVGNKIKIKTYNKINERRNFSGILKGLDKEMVEVETDSESAFIPLDEISKARVEVYNTSGGK